jgi:hypothetical protein
MKNIVLRAQSICVRIKTYNRSIHVEKIATRCESNIRAHTSGSHKHCAKRETNDMSHNSLLSKIVYEKYETAIRRAQRNVTTASG